MTGTELLEYLQTLPNDILKGDVVIANCIEPLSTDMFTVKHSPIRTIRVDTRSNELVLFDEENRNTFDQFWGTKQRKKSV